MDNQIEDDIFPRRCSDCKKIIIPGHKEQDSVLFQCGCAYILCQVSIELYFNKLKQI